MKTTSILMNCETYVVKHGDLRIHAIDTKVCEIHVVGCVVDVFVPCDAESERLHLKEIWNFYLILLKFVI